MVAVIREREPVGPGHDLLEFWALWNRGGAPGGAKEWAVKERLDPPHEDDIPEKAVLVDRLVAKLGVDYPDYRRMLKHYYLGQESYWQIAGTLQRTPGFVRLSIQGACDLIHRQYEVLTTAEA